MLLIKTTFKFFLLLCIVANSIEKNEFTFIFNDKDFQNYEVAHRDHRFQSLFTDLYLNTSISTISSTPKAVSKKSIQKPKKINVDIVSNRKKNIKAVSNRTIKRKIEFLSPSYLPVASETNQEIISPGIDIHLNPVETEVSFDSWSYYFDNYRFGGIYTLTEYLSELERSFVSPSLASKSVINDISDDVKMSSSSVKKVKTINSKSDDLVFYNINKPKSTIDTGDSISLMASTTDVSSTVQQTIQREISKRSRKNLVASNESNYSKYKKNSDLSPASLFSSVKEKDESLPKIQIKGHLIGLNKPSKLVDLKFELVPWYDNDEYIYDTDGVAEIQLTSHSVSSQLDLTYRSQDTIPVNINVSYDEFSDAELVKLYNVYTFKTDDFYSYLLNNSIPIEKIESLGHVLLKKEKGFNYLLDVDVFQRIYFDENFKKTTSDKSAYILFVGVRQGNVLLTAENDKNTAQKIITIIGNEITYDSDNLIKANVVKFNLFERQLLSSNSKELDINAEDISFFNSKSTAMKNGLNNYEVAYPYRFTSFRDYLDLSHLEQHIFIGSRYNNELEIPSQDFINYIKNSFNVSSMDNSCLIQVNLRNKIEKITYDGISYRGYMQLSHLLLDKDGAITNEVTELASNIFLKGEHEGVVNLKIDYLDGTSDYVRSICSSKTYLIEQL